MRYFKEKQWFSQWWLHLIVTLPILAGLFYFCFQWYAYEKPVDKVGPNDYGTQWFILILLLVTAALIFIFRLHTSIDEKGIHYRFFPFHRTSKSIKWNEMQSCEVRKYHPIGEYGGWGIRGLSKKNGAYNVKGDQGIQILLKNGHKLLIGTQRPEEAQRTIDKYFKNK